MAKSSLQKSHSKASNFKLTLICLLLTISSSALWAGIALATIGSHLTLGIIISAASAVLFILSYLLVTKFTR